MLSFQRNNEYFNTILLEKIKIDNQLRNFSHYILKLESNFERTTPDQRYNNPIGVNKKR